jgi:hypothetical protein
MKADGCIEILIESVDSYIDLAVERQLRLEDIGLGPDPGEASVKSFCDEFAQRLVQRYFSNDLSWEDADAAANHYYLLMIHHCGSKLPDYAWEVFIAFDEGEIDERGDGITRERLVEIQRKYARE